MKVLLVLMDRIEVELKGIDLPLDLRANATPDCKEGDIFMLRLLLIQVQVQVQVQVDLEDCEG